MQEKKICVKKGCAIGCCLNKANEINSNQVFGAILLYLPFFLELSARELEPILPPCSNVSIKIPQNAIFNDDLRLWRSTAISEDFGVSGVFGDFRGSPKNLMKNFRGSLPSIILISIYLSFNRDEMFCGLQNCQISSTTIT